MSAWTLLGTLIIGGAAFLLLSGFIKTWRLYHGVRIITCPENLQPAAVSVAALDAAKWFAIAGEKELHLRSCSRWPEMAGCDEACLTQIEAAPLACRVQSIVTSWYEGKSCHFCQRPIEHIVWHERPPAVLLNGGTTREWKEIVPEELPKVFATAAPVCWACHIVETFRHEHPEKVIQRVRMPAASKAIPPSANVF